MVVSTSPNNNGKYIRTGACPGCGRDRATKGKLCCEDPRGYIHCQKCTSKLDAPPGMRFVGLDSYGCGVFAPVDRDWRPRQKHSDKTGGQKSATNKVSTVAPEKSKEDTEKDRKREAFLADRQRSCDWYACDENPDSQTVMSFFRDALANSLRLDPASIPPDMRFDGKGGAWRNQYDQHGKVVGKQVRFYGNGKKLNFGHLGISRSDDWNADPTAPLLMPEGNSNQFALRDPAINHLATISRPSNLAGREILAEFLVLQGFAAGDRYEHRDLYVVGDNDEKSDGSWPGREGAAKTAQVVANHVGRAVKMFFPPRQYKDLRDWVIALKASPNSADADVIFWDWIENNYEVIEPNECRPIQPGETVDQFTQRQMDFLFNGVADAKLWHVPSTTPSPPSKKQDPVKKIVDDAGILPPHRVRHLEHHNGHECGTIISMYNSGQDKQIAAKVDCGRWIDCPHCHAVNQYLAAIRLGAHVHKLRVAFIYTGHVEHVEAAKEQMDNAERRRLLSIARLKTRTVFKIDPKDRCLFKFVSLLVYKAIRVRERSNSKANRQAAVAKLNSIAKELVAKLGHRNEELCTRRILEVRQTRKLGNFASIMKIGGTRFLISDRKFPGARKVTGPDGVAELCAAIKSIPWFYCRDEEGTRKPVTSSAAWQPKKRESDGVKKFVVDTEAQKLIEQISVVKCGSTMATIREHFANNVSQTNLSIIGRATETMFINLGPEAYHAGLRKLVREINPSEDDVSDGGAEDFEIRFESSRSWSVGDEKVVTTNSVKYEVRDPKTACTGARAGP